MRAYMRYEVEVFWFFFSKKNCFPFTSFLWRSVALMAGWYQSVGSGLTEENRLRWALAGRPAHGILVFRLHLADQHDGVAVIMQFEQFGGDPQADAETGADLRVDMHFHGRPAATGSNSKLM